MGYITNVVVKTRQTDATGVSMRKQIIYKAKLSYVRVAKKSHWDSVFLSLVFVLFCDGRTPPPRNRHQHHHCISNNSSHSRSVHVMANGYRYLQTKVSSPFITLCHGKDQEMIKTRKESS